MAWRKLPVQPGWALLVTTAFVMAGCTAATPAPVVAGQNQRVAASSAPLRPGALSPASPAGVAPVVQLQPLVSSQAQVLATDGAPVRQDVARAMPVRRFEAAAPAMQEEDMLAENATTAERRGKRVILRCPA